MTGIVKRLMREKLFGFIKGDNNKDYFFHRSGCYVEWNQIDEGLKVSFDEGTSSKGPRAENVVAFEG